MIVYGSYQSVSVKVSWSSECNAVFRKFKMVLCSACVLNSPDFSQKFILPTDASDRAVGAVLSQVNEGGK